MLEFLSIENFALIERLEVEFQPGLSLITGETGSGKSILVDAVGLLVGERASQEMVRQGFERARVEGIFALSGRNPTRTRLEMAGLDCHNDELIIRREISHGGANKVFVNGVLTTQGFLSELGACLADIHGQHDQQALLNSRTHVEFLDAFGDNESLVSEVRKLFQDWQEVLQTLASWRSSEQDRLQRLDTLDFQVTEIERLRLKPGLDLELGQERAMLSSAEKRSYHSGQGYELLYEQEPSVIGLVDQAEKHLHSLAELDPSFETVKTRLKDLRYQIEEIAYQLRDYAARVESNPRRLEEIEERLAEIQKARRKYGESIEGILAYAEAARREVLRLSHRESQIGELQTREQELSAAYFQSASRLSEKRRQDADALRLAVERELADLAMQNTVFVVDLRTCEQRPTEKGIDEAEFLISPNVGEAPRPLTKIASGGELSRIILGLKSILTLEDYPKTLVFDEVDAGIGGRVASSVGERLARLAEQHQVFCVTHLPQIASHANHHFYVDKTTRGSRTTVMIKLLEPTQRVDELARMLAGDQITDATRRHARELLHGPARRRAR